MQPPTIAPPICWSCQAPIGRGVDHCSSCGARQPERWEYHIETMHKGIGWSYHLNPKQVAVLNRLGSQGWELVAVEGQAGVHNATVSHSLVFKRRII